MYVYLVNIPGPVQYHIYAMAFPFDLRRESVTHRHTHTYMHAHMHKRTHTHMHTHNAHSQCILTFKTKILNLKRSMLFVSLLFGAVINPHSLLNSIVLF